MLQFTVGGDELGGEDTPNTHYKKRTTRLVIVYPLLDFLPSANNRPGLIDEFSTGCEHE